MNNGEIIIYKNEDGLPAIDVAMQNDTVWLSQQQMSLLFDRDYKTISRHIGNIFKEGELSKEAVVVKYATTASDGKTYQVEHYNLDLIISVGYRVKSKEGTKFRIWANQILKDYLVKGYALNDKKLKAQEQQLKELKDVIKLIDQVQHNYTLDQAEMKDTYKILVDYVYALDMLDQYDHQQLEHKTSDLKSLFRIDYDQLLRPLKIYV